jgi:hypothetical protein
MCVKTGTGNADRENDQSLTSFLAGEKIFDVITITAECMTYMDKLVYFPHSSEYLR